MPTHEQLHPKFDDQENTAESHPLEETLLTLERANIDPAFTVSDVDRALVQGAMEMAQTYRYQPDWQTASRALYEPAQAAYERVTTREADKDDQQRTPAASDPNRVLGPDLYNNPTYRAAEHNFLKYHPDLAKLTEAFDNPDALKSSEEITALIIESSGRISAYSDFYRSQAQHVILAHAAAARRRVHDSGPTLPDFRGATLRSDPENYIATLNKTWELVRSDPDLDDMMEDFVFSEWHPILKSEEEIKHHVIECTVEASIAFKNSEQFDLVKRLIHVRAQGAYERLELSKEKAEEMRQQDEKFRHLRKPENDDSSPSDLEVTTDETPTATTPLMRAYNAALEQAERTRRLIRGEPEEIEDEDAQSKLSAEIRYWLIEHLAAWLEELQAVDAEKPTKQTLAVASASHAPRKPGSKSAK